MQWIDTTVGEYCPFIYGKGLPQRNRKTGQIPVYGSNGIVDFHCDSYVKGAGIIIGRKGSVGAVHLSKNPFWPIDTSFYLEKSSIEELYFTYYLLKSLGLEQMNTDSAVPGLNRENAHALPIRIPEREQDRKLLGAWIAAFDEKIEINTKTNQTLEQIAQSIFKSWFVDFDPVKAKIAVLESGGTAEQAELAAMSSISAKDEAALKQMQAEQPDRYAELAQTAALFPSKMVDSELGEIPEGWTILPLDQIANYQNGLALQKFKPKNEKEFLPVVKIAQLKKGVADGEEKAAPDIRAECIIDNGDVIFSWSGSLVVDIWCGGKAALNQHLFKVTSKIFPKWFYYYFTIHHLAEFQRIAADKAVTMGHIKREHLKDAMCPIATGELISKANKLIGHLLEKQIEQRLENNSLNLIRDSLLPKLLSGELPIPETNEASA